MTAIFAKIPWRYYWKRLSHYGIAILIFLIGIIISLLAFRFYQQQDWNRTRVQFDRVADLRIFLLKDILIDTLEQLEYINRLFTSSGNVTNDEFNLFAKEILKNYPNILSIGCLIDNMQSSHNEYPKPSLGIQFINFLESSSESPIFFPLNYLVQSNIHPLFFHVKFYSQFLKLLENSKADSNVIVSKNVTYLHEKEGQGFFLFKSIFLEKKEKNLPLKHRNFLLGSIIGFSNFEDIVENIRSKTEPTGINIRIFDITEDNEILLYFSEAKILKDPAALTKKETELQESWSRSQIFPYGNHQWKIQITPTIEFIRLNHNPYSHMEVPIFGLLISAIMSSYFLVLANRRVQIEQEVLDRTNELANINRILQQEIHERERMESDILVNQNYLQKRHEALEYLTKLTTSELHNAIHEVILRTAIVMQVDRIGVWFYENIGNSEKLACEGMYILSTNSFSDHLEINAQHFPRYFQVLSKYSHLIIPSATDGELNQELSSYLTVFHINSKLDIPIVFEGKLLGILSCEETRGHHEWSLEDRHFGQTIADIISIIIEQSARRKAENALKESEEQLRFISQRSIDGIVSINNKEEIVTWNYGAYIMFGYTEEEVLGKSLKMIIPHDEFLHLHETSTKPIELQGIRKNGQSFSVEISLTRWESNEAYFDTIMIRDISERKEFEKRIIKAMREARAANEAKSEFLATISHELRTPLNAIIGFNQCLIMGMDGAVNQQQSGSLEKIEKSAFHLLTLINNILDWSKIEAKKMELEISQENIVELINSCVEEVQSLAQQKNLTIHLSIERPFVLVEIDKMRIRQVLLNLLSNAIKFTEKGSISIVLINEFYQVQIEIHDTGIGLDEEEIEKIFQPFSQADSSITRKYGGTGLGLVISKNIVDLHGGSIKVKSKKNNGSIFTIILPKNQ